MPEGPSRIAGYKWHQGSPGIGLSTVSSTALLRAPTQFEPGRSGTAIATPTCCCCCCCVATLISTAVFPPIRITQIERARRFYRPGASADNIPALLSVLALPLSVFIAILAGTLIRTTETYPDYGDVPSYTFQTSHPEIGAIIGALTYIALHVGAVVLLGGDRRAIYVAIMSIVVSPVAFVVEAIACIYIIFGLANVDRNSGNGVGGWFGFIVYLVLVGLAIFGVAKVVCRKRPNEPQLTDQYAGYGPPGYPVPPPGYQLPPPPGPPPPTPPPPTPPPQQPPGK